MSGLPIPPGGSREPYEMKDLVRVVLVDPNAESRNDLRRLLGAIATIWVAEVFDTYRGMGSRVAEIAPDLSIVTLDHDPNQAIELIQSLTQANPGAVVLPASAISESSLILRAMRAGARE